MTSSTDPAPPTQDTLVGWLSHWAEVQPTAPALSYVDYARHREGLVDTVRWSELDQLTRALAVRLHEAGARPRDRAAILTPQGNLSVLAFLGCLAAGIVAVPLLGPDVAGQGGRLELVLGECDPEFVLTTRDALPVIRRFVEQCAGADARKLVAVDDLDLGSAARYAAPEPRGADVAYLRFSSGSSGAPAGAMITHANLVANVRQARQACGAGDTGITAVNWLPPLQDLGLLATIGLPMLLGQRSVYLAPLAFAQRPARWLWLLSRFSRCYGAAPDFAFEQCTRIPRRERTGLDLRGVQCLLNGGEPIRAGIVERFREEFTPHGLAPGALRTAYGLAEATALVTTGDPTITAFDAEGLGTATARAAPPDSARARRLVAAGRPAGQLVRIVEPEWCTELDDGWVGEIWLHGTNIAAGYWGRPQRPPGTFGARLESPSAGTPRQPWLRTGDLGFLHQGLLYVTGRIEDLIIAAGFAHCPQDVEHTVRKVHPVLCRDRIAAFGFVDEETGSERVVVLVEVAPRELPRLADRRDIELALRRALLTQHGLRLHDLTYLRPGSLPRTGSGKIQRARCRTRYQAGELPAVVRAH
ncbi:fatty acyl-AMP ligase [Amycolatopsis aidingensis]|uniref:fatty acyl-AMP ligase n=1 Tax=Amycolatopsis aidingensis TaxID=2842453 RepID=UPI001C0E775D|nr:fatty acyl-AMP ligase [Amycolatopsis aidingensis]